MLTPYLLGPILKQIYAVKIIGSVVPNKTKATKFQEESKSQMKVNLVLVEELMGGEIV